MLVEDALRNGYSHVLFWDSDMCPPLDGLLRLLQRDVPIVSGLCFGRTWPHFPIDYELESGNLNVNDTLDYVRKHAEQLFVDNFRGATLPPDHGTLVRQPLVGMAFTLIESNALKNIRPPWFAFPSTEPRGEDMVFSHKARDAGYTCWLDRSVVVGHGYGDQFIGPSDFAGFITQEDTNGNLSD